MMQFFFTLIFLSISITLFSQNTTLDAEESVITFHTEQPASFPGGIAAFNQYNANNLKYPKKEKRKRVEGKVFIEFVIAKNGTISDVKCVKGLTEALNQEGVRLIQNSPPWKPGKFDGKVGAQRFVYPVEFKLPVNK